VDYSRPRANGIIAIDLRGDDQLVGVNITNGERDAMLFTSAGKAIRFNESNVRAMGRTAGGVRGIKLTGDAKVISLIVADEGCVLTATENGFGKRTVVDQYPCHGRGGQGVISIVCNDRNGTVVGAVQVADDDQIMLISDGGTLVRTRVAEVSVLGRNTQGVKLIGLSGGEKLVGVERVVEEPVEEESVEELKEENSDETES
jgi:DNA gyrase subunit A